jgi:hypothetical protein
MKLTGSASCTTAADNAACDDVRVPCPQVLSHDWVTDSGKLPAVHQASSQSGAAEAQAKETGQALTALKKQVGD